MTKHDDEAAPAPATAFREAIRSARSEPVEVVPPLDRAPLPAPVVVHAAPAEPRRYEYRIERTKGSRKRRVTRLSRLGRKGWELVGIDGRYAYLKRPKR